MTTFVITPLAERPDCPCQKIPGAGRLPIALDEENQMRADWIRAYCDRHHPDVILSTDSDILNNLRMLNLRVPKDIALICLDIQRNPKLSGIDQNQNMIGASAVDQLDLLHRTNQRGLDAHERMTVINGRWQEGTTVSTKAPRRH